MGTKRFTPILEAAMKDAGLDADKDEKFDGIVVVGGGTRIPIVQRTLEALDLPIHKDLNADEAVALGAAFRAANISTTFRVRHIGMTDISANPVLANIVD